MELQEKREDYKKRKYKLKTIIRNCKGCKYLSCGFYHNVCRVKNEIIEFNIIGLFCRYYDK